MKARVGAALRRGTQRVRNRSCLLVLAVAASASPALAHHSAAMFDMSKSVELKGAVKEWHWTNPHSWLVMEARDASGKTTTVSIEANGPGYLARTGWKRESLKPGDAVTATINPLKDGSPGGNLVKVAMADGRELSARPVRAKEANVPGAAPQAAGATP